ncbi:MAG: ATP-binding protein [Betaproteobacteria bacterium HGW-Betaproteobacteria-1]|jgi:hypothetical protein|nr:MAG: ATP-binding protein [Betaproteobacteria bacterium HGW-Betaproteobacteria-1]
MTSRLVQHVKIARHYQRAIRIDSDLGRSEALDGYICHKTAKMVLENMSNQVLGTQWAFTWTGPFGGGKSSLALTLTSALLADAGLRNKARETLAPEILEEFDQAFPVKKGWNVLAITGKKANPVEEIGHALNAGNNELAIDTTNQKEVLNALLSASLSNDTDGLLLVIDEMGKFLEYCAHTGGDLHFFQDLAEYTQRGHSKFIVIGILHQSFRQYANKLGQETKEEWAKIQGRYSDIPLISTSDEVVELIGKAIQTDQAHDWTAQAAKVIAQAIQKRRPTIGKEFTERLDACWPLHPAVAAILGPASRRQFGQNERSTFGFLTSSEPHAFKAFLHQTPLEEHTLYTPADYWEFLRANLESAIIGSSDGHRWALAVEAVTKVQARSDGAEVDLMKCIAILDLFKSDSGLYPNVQVLHAIHPDQSEEAIELALERFSKWRVAIYRSHLEAWGIFEGSDFDIDAALKQSRNRLGKLEPSMLSTMAGLRPIVAKRHYQETGTLRWMDFSLISLEDALNEPEELTDGSFGRFLLIIPETSISESTVQKKIAAVAKSLSSLIIFGLPTNYKQINDLGLELLALKQIDTSAHEIAGDQVAKRELAARIAATSSALQSELRASMDKAKWWIGNKWKSNINLSQLASESATRIFHSAPKLKSELVNRDSLSSNAVKARRDLLHRMILNENEENLGLTGWPAERGLHETLLNLTGLHRQNAAGIWRIQAPSQTDPGNLQALWDGTDRLFTSEADRILVSDVYTHWKAEPFGVKEGVMPLLIAAYILSRRDQIAIYDNGIFQHTFDDASMDLCLQQPTKFSLRKIHIDASKNDILLGIANVLSKAGIHLSIADPLDTARGLVGFIFNLPEWTQRTSSLSRETSKLREHLLRASDPHKLLFIDLPILFEAKSIEEYVARIAPPILELFSAYKRMVTNLGNHLMDALDARGDIKELNHRAEIVLDISGDLRFNGFVTRIMNYDGSFSSLEGILSQAGNKPPPQWNDNTINEVYLELEGWATKFKQVEALAAVKHRTPTRSAFAVVLGSGSDARVHSRVFDVNDRDKQMVFNLASEITEKFNLRDLSPEIALAALAHASLQFSDEVE